MRPPLSIYRLLFFFIALTLAFHGTTSWPISHAQDSKSLLIESDAPQIIQAGKWLTQTAAAASNGSYLYSSGAEVDELALAFVGSAVEVIYVAGPQFGTLAIEVDGTVLRTVITTSDKIAYGQSTQVNYLSDEPHTLKIYAQAEGVIAVDAFQVTLPTEHTSATQPVEDVLANDVGEGIQSAPCAPTSVIHRVSITNRGVQGNASSQYPSLSADGRFVAFESLAVLTPGDANGNSDIYVYDRQSCTVQLVSVSSTGIAGIGNSQRPSISGNGRYVSFHSQASNLVAGDTNGVLDVFVHDRQTGITTRASVATGGVQANSNSNSADISADGRYISFFSSATNLAPNDTNAQFDVFVHDRQLGITTRVSVATGGGEATGGYSISPRISGDGRYVTFESLATNLVAGDTNAGSDVFVHDRQTGITTRVSVATGGVQANGFSGAAEISDNGRLVTFESSSSNLVAGDTNGVADVFIHDRTTGITTRASVATGGTQAIGNSAIGVIATISNDGRYVAFESSATNLVTGDTNGVADVFIHDRTTGITRRVSISSEGLQSPNASVHSTISGDGQYIAFESSANNLIPNDNNGTEDIFVAPVAQPPTDKLALFQTNLNMISVLNTLQDNPPYTAYTAFSAYAPVNGGQWVMGDWDGDGLKTPGIYANGPFYYTNKGNESQLTDWNSVWIGIAGPPVSGRFSIGLRNDCLGAIQASPSGGQTVFVLYFTCDFSGNTTPSISSQWLSAVLPDSGGFSGVYQFGAGDFDGNGIDSIAVRRGPYVAFGNISPITGPANFNLAQYIGAPLTTDYGIFVVGNWDTDVYDSFGLFYQNGELFYRNDHLFNSGAYNNQSVGTPFGSSGVQATTWR